MARPKRTALKGIPLKAKVITKHAKKLVNEASMQEADDGLTDLQRKFFAIHTIPEMLQFAKSNDGVEIEAVVLNSDRKSKSKFTTKAKLFEAIKANETDGKKSKLLEDAFGADAFDFQASGPGLVGQDIIPLIGGPFAKQLYYQDYIRMHMQAFYAYHNDPAAKAIVRVIKDFSLGRGWSVEAKGKEKAVAQILWDSFKEANKLEKLMEYVATELSIYGEIMMWTLPGMETSIGYQDPVSQQPAKGILPRVRLVDPSSCWDIITYPEDITRVLAYQIVAPTQYQTYTQDDKTGITVPTLKFMYQQIPGEQIKHYKINSVSNEKRGRSDLYPVMNYLKRLRDTINYAVIAMQKAAAWSIDTTIDGSQDDIDAYVSSQNELGTIPPAGSEFVHSKAVERNYLDNNSGATSGSSDAFSWLLSMIAMGSGVPVSYFGTHIVATSSRASASTAVEPLFKFIEMRREPYAEILSDMFNALMKKAKINATCDVVFPEIMVEDRSEKLANLELAESSKWISHETASNLGAKELSIRDYNFENEQAKAAQDTPPMGAMPLTGDPKIDGKSQRQPFPQKGSKGKSGAKDIPNYDDEEI